MEQLKFDISELNQGQTIVFNGLCDFLSKKNNQMAVIMGFAGTGKTYIINKLIKYINSKYPGFRIAVTGPTNKAVKVLAKTSSFKDTRVEYKTVHKLLGLKESINNDGTIDFVKSNLDRNDIDKFKILIVDEVSMLDDKLFIEIQNYSNRLKIIFMGDPAQIPPVGKPDCIPFNDEKKSFFDFLEFKLTEIMRQSFDNPIIESSFMIRNNLLRHVPIEHIKTNINSKEHGIIRIDANKSEDRDYTMMMFKKYFKSKQFEKDADYAKIIAWRNVTVNKTNNIIRNIIYGENLDRIMIGEKLICNKPITDGVINASPLFNTSDEFVVDEFEIATDIYKTIHGNTRLKYYDTKVISIDIEGTERKTNIKILHEDSDADFNTICKALMENAKKLKGAQRSWIKYYEFLREFADINYNYGSTVHKSQGSTYRNVFIIEDDIDMNTNIFERNRCKYVAYTRASERLFIIKK